MHKGFKKCAVKVLLAYAKGIYSPSSTAGAKEGEGLAACPHDMHGTRVSACPPLARHAAFQGSTR